MNTNEIKTPCLKKIFFYLRISQNNSWHEKEWMMICKNIELHHIILKLATEAFIYLK